MSSYRPLKSQMSSRNNSQYQPDRMLPKTAEGRSRSILDSISAGNTPRAPLVNTIAYTELNRMKLNCRFDEDPDKVRKQKEKEDLYEKSQMKIQNWPNTLLANQKKKKDEKFIKFTQQEMEFRKIDEYEALLKETNRQRDIKKANNQIYENEDRVKAFNSKMILVDAMQERETQMKLKQAIKEQEEQREILQQEWQKELIALQEIEEQKKVQILKEKKLAQAKVLKEQHDEFKNNYITKMQNEKIESEILKSRANEAMEQEKKDQIFKKKRATELSKEIQEGNRWILQQRQLLKQREKEEEKKFKIYADKKDLVNKIREEREQGRRNELAESREAILAVQSKNLLAKKKLEDERSERLEQELKAKEDIAEKKKIAKLKILEQQVLASRKLSMLCRDEEKKRQTDEDKKFQGYWKKQNQLISEKEKKVIEDRFLRSKTLQEYHIKQINEKQQERDDLFNQELNDAEHISRKYENVDNDFENWAARAIHEYNNDGKNIIPLLKEIKDYKKQQH